MTSLLARPSEIIAPSAPPTIAEDDTLPRDKRGRPRIWVPEKKALRSYTRTTTYIDVIEDKTALSKWGKRMVLKGATYDPALVNAARNLDNSVREEKQKLDALCEQAVALAGANEKRDKGSHLHKLSEYVDRGEPLPPCTEQDLLDMMAYKSATVNFDVESIESPVVLDELQIAGTPDRTLRYSGPGPVEGLVFDNALLIGDLKTGTVDYGALKMAMQLSIYSRAVFYNPETHERTPMPEDLSQEWGIIINLPAGSGEATVYWIDLTVGWEAVLVAQQVRTLRNKRKVLIPASI